MDSFYGRDVTFAIKGANKTVKCHHHRRKMMTPVRIKEAKSCLINTPVIKKKYVKPGIRNVDERRFTQGRVTNMFVFCGLGKLLRKKLKEDGHTDIKDRGKVMHVLRWLYGTTFDEGAHFYKAPNTNVFMAHMLHVASNGKIDKTADVSKLFTFDKVKNRYYMIDGFIEKFGFQKTDLCHVLEGWIYKASHGITTLIPL
jgi:hypothetical protein